MIFELVVMCAPVQKPSVSVLDFGVRANTRDDCTDAVAKAIAKVRTLGGQVVFPKGEYHFYREFASEKTLYLSNTDAVNPRRISILVEGCKNITFQGKGAKLVFHDRVIPFAILGSSKVTVRGFEIDWERPMMSQGTVAATDPQGLTLSIDADAFPYRIDQGKLLFTDRDWARPVWSFMEFDPATGGVAYKTGDWGCLGDGWRDYRAVELERGKVRLDYPFKRLPAIGSVLVARHGSRDHAGTFIADSTDVTFEDVAYRFTSGLGLLAQYTENLTLRRVQVAPAPGSNRLFAGHDDAFHVSNCKGQVNVEGCRFEGLMDDPINVHGTAVRITQRVAPNQLACRFMHNQSIGLRFGDAGDTVSFLDHDTLLSIGRAKIRSIKRTSAEDLFVAFDRPVPANLRVGDALENLTWTPSLNVKGCTFGGVRARGLLVSTPGKVRIENNLFKSSGSAILIAGDANGWYETGAVKDVLIRNNRFDNCLTSPYQFCEAVISVFPEIPKLAAEPYHRNIRIEGNTFEAFDAPLLWAKSAAGLTFSANTVRNSSRFQPWHWNKDGITLLGCRDVIVSDNIIDRDYRSRSVMIVGGKPDTIVIDGWK